MTVKKSVKLPKNKTKIVCTIGPASQDEKTLEKMIKAGMSVARLNFSHGTLKEHEQIINKIKKISKKTDKHISILADLPGSKIRIGLIEGEPVELNSGEKVVLTNDDILGNKNIIPVAYDRLTQDLEVGKTVFINDGLIELKVLNITEELVECRIVTGGILFSHKGINFPGVNVNIKPVSKRDLEIIDFCLDLDVSIFSISFVESKEDIEKVRKFAEKKGKNVHLIAKIERDEAVCCFDEILRVSDGIMIARGDLGMEIPIENVPTVQKRLIRRANIFSRPVITATQMLKSMTEYNRPTRAEVTDVANAILDGTDAIMLSEETAVGKYPVISVKTMAKIAASTEKKRNGEGLPSNMRDYLKKTVDYKELSIADVISLNVLEASNILKPRYILSTTATGRTAQRISRFKPDCWILSFSRNINTCRFLQFSFGVYPFHMENKKKSWHDLILRFIKKYNLVKKDDRIILTQRRFEEEKGSTDSFGIIKI